MPLSLETLPTGKTYLFLHTGASEIRPENEAEQTEETPATQAAPAQENTTK